ncbi:MAG: DUF6488 family protein [Sulfurimonas sp.]|jgi:hypothetical protein
MKNKIKNLVVAGILCFGVAGLAHGGASSGGHSHNAPKEILVEDRIIEVSQKYIEELVKNQKIDSSWKNNTFMSAKKQKFNDNLEWIIKFQNLNVKDSAKQSLFIFVDLYGTVNAANYSGK